MRKDQVNAALTARAGESVVNIQQVVEAQASSNTTAIVSTAW